MPKAYRAYLYTRSTKKKDTDTTKLRVRVVAKGRELTAVIPLLVSANFSKFYNSNGTLKDGCKAVSFREQYESKCIKAAYKAACKVTEFMLSNGDDYWLLAPNSHFAYWIESVYNDICDGRSINKTNLDLHLETQAAWKAQGYPTHEEENLADWRFAAGIGPEPPMGVGSHSDKEAWDNYFKSIAEGGKEE